MGWKELFLVAHPAMFCQVGRYDLNRPVEVATDNRFHVRDLVEGEPVWFETANGSRPQSYLGETFVVPAAAGSYRLIPDKGKLCRVVKVFVK